jgi:hypothetical protein
MLAIHLGIASMEAASPLVVAPRRSHEQQS